LLILPVGTGIVWSDGRRWRVGDVWFSYDHRGSNTVSGPDRALSRRGAPEALLPYASVQVGPLLKSTHRYNSLHPCTLGATTVPAVSHSARLLSLGSYREWCRRWF
jgi:hypothetical protein